MQAVIFPRYGDYNVLERRETKSPSCGANQVLVKVHASSVNKADWYYIAGHPFPVRFMAGGLWQPKYNIPGADIAGIVTELGSKVTSLKVGDPVIGDLSNNSFGGWAEVAAISESYLAPKPESLNFIAAACLPVAGVTALQGLRDHGQIKSGMHVLINGASGGVGSFAVQIAKAYGAAVTAVSRSDKATMVQAIGADVVIDYQTTDYTRLDKSFDLIFDAAAYRSLADNLRVLKPGGTYLLAGGSLSGLAKVGIFGPVLSMINGKKIKNFLSRPNREDLTELARLCDAGKIKPYVDQTFPLAEAAKALAYFDQRQVKGKVAITVL